MRLAADLALKVLRLMLREEKNNAEGEMGDDFYDDKVGAFTATINAVAKEGNLKSAIKLFRSMEKYNSKPNEITCGCLIHHLLNKNLKDDGLDDAMEILGYMKENHLKPNEVIYASLISANNQRQRVYTEREEGREPWQKILDVYFSIKVVENSE